MTCSARSLKRVENILYGRKKLQRRVSKKWVDKVTFRAVDQNGNPIKNVKFSFLTRDIFFQQMKMEKLTACMVL